MDIFDFIEDKHYDYEKALKHRPIKLFEAFAGIGCQAMALNKLQIPYESVGISEIDKYAILSYNAIHGETKNYGDICKMKEIPKCDIFTWSFPCTDLSKAGKQAGLTDTRSGLVYEVLRLLQVTTHKPKVLIMENVVDLVQVKFMAEFYEIQKEIAALGYTNYTQTINAKHHGVAQNRDRVFMVSILGDYRYEFPPRIKLEKRLKDYLEDNVVEKYYLSEKQIKGIQNSTFETTKRRIQENGVCDTLCARNYKDPKCVQVAQLDGKHEQTGRVYGSEGLSPTINTCGGGNREPKILDIGNYSPSNHSASKIVDKFEDGDCADISFPNGYNKANRVNKGFAPAITGTTVKSLVAKTQLRIRKLTPLECWRLMGIDDEDFYKAQKVVSNSQLYKQAGNGIVVDVFAQILKGLIQ